VKITLLRTPASSPKSECAGCCQQGHACSKTLHQQNPPVLNWRCRLTQVTCTMAVKPWLLWTIKSAIKSTINLKPYTRICCGVCGSTVISFLICKRWSKNCIWSIMMQKNSVQLLWSLFNKFWSHCCSTYFQTALVYGFKLLQIYNKHSTVNNNNYKQSSLPHICFREWNNWRWVWARHRLQCEWQSQPR